MRSDVATRLEARKVANSPTVALLRILQIDTQAVWSKLMSQEVALEPMETQFTELERRLAQEHSEFEELLNTWQRLDRSELADEETRAIEIMKWADEQHAKYLPEATELRKLLGALVGDRHSGTLRTTEEVYINPQEWQEIHTNLRTLQTSHRKALKDFSDQQQRGVSDEVPHSIDPTAARHKKYNWLDASTWTPTPGGIVYLNGLTQADVEQADPARVPKLMQQLGQLTLYGQHNLNPVVGRVYHRHILNGAGGIAFTYRLDPETYTVTPCVVDISTQRPSRESSNKYHWQKTGAFDYNPPLPK